MCDEDTESDNATYLAQARLGRREVGMGAGAVVATMVTGCGPAAAAPASGAAVPPTDATPTAAEPEAVDATAEGTSRRMVTIETPDGTADALLIAPSRGRHPAVLVWPDIAGVRDAFEAMATRLAGEGYAVLTVNQYYRSTKLPLFTTFSQWQTDEGKAKIGPMRAALTAKGIASDGAAFVAWLDQQPEVDTGRKIATTGYCMGGPFTFRTAAAAPTRVGAVASFHGGGLVTEDADSPHALLPTMKGAALICIAQNDDERQPDAKSTLRQAADAAHVVAEIEVYPAQHGWCVTDSPVYDETQAERAWARMLATFEANL
jgi:carboxymethylenebutenolidase